MRGKRLSIGLRAALAIFTAILFVTSIWAAAEEKVLHNFNNDGTDGYYPEVGLIVDAAGNLYGTTTAGGAYNSGTVFELTPAAGGGWTETVLHNFGNGTDGATPYAGLIFDAAGNLYGTTQYGGTYGVGTVFELTPAGGGSWTEKVLYSFNLNGTDGAVPEAGLIVDAAGNLYGTTYFGGTYLYGTVFELTPAGGGGWTEQVLHSFNNNGADGSLPAAGLIFDAAGNLYGTTVNGGTGSNCVLGCGTVFELTPAAGGGWTEQVLHSFNNNGADGSTPFAGLIFDAAGNLYGTTFAGGTYGYGTVFELTPAAGGGWTETVLHNFGNGTDGTAPYAGLIFDAAGNLYGTTSYGGTYNYGTVFELTPAAGGGWTETVLHNFGNGTDGITPYAGLIFDAAGNLYGTTFVGGTYGYGTVFEVTPVSVAEQFVPLSQPCRAVDTRPEHGGGGPIQGNTYQNFPISGAGTCGVLTSAAVYSMNVSVVPNGSLGYLTVWPTGQPQPLVSTLNSLDGRIKANAAIIPAGTNGEISVYATNTTNVIVDVNGYFAPVSGSTLAFYPLTPCRVADTRHSTYPPGLGPPYLTGGQERAFPILNATTTCNIPSSGVAAYSLNFSVVPHGSLFYMTVWPTGESRPTVSTLNDIPGQIIANAAVVVAGTGGDVSVYPTNDTDLVIDINGYFAAAGTGGLSLYGVPPCRVIDTRKIGSGLPFSGTLSPPVDVVDSPCGISSLAQAYVFNASVVPYGALGYLTLWPDGATQPLVSTLNALDGSISSNMAIVPSTNGKVDAYASGLTQLILDISSYFAP
jgi:uncharacterized repeat protein (TIGR03803 family)